MIEGRKEKKQKKQQQQQQQPGIVFENYKQCTTELIANTIINLN